MTVQRAVVRLHWFPQSFWLRAWQAGLSITRAISPSNRLVRILRRRRRNQGSVLIMLRYLRVQRLQGQTDIPQHVHCSVAIGRRGRNLYDRLFAPARRSRAGEFGNGESPLARTFLWCANVYESFPANSDKLPR